ncbi:hypothetical protein BBJ28_00017330 [Nothophytophthora sp. Chile5]|nr:hypothetical protein BBJ28_00017330 [Nothophytophthora sp. Chile5]
MVEKTPNEPAIAGRVSAAAPSAAARGHRSVDKKAGLRSGSKHQPSFVFLRLKRKRTDDPMECLVVHSEPELKKPHTAGGAVDANASDSKPPTGERGLLQAFTKLSTSEKRFVFKHIDTMEEQHVTAPSRAKWTERLKRKARSLKDERAELLAKKSVAPVFQKAPTAVSTPASKQTQSRVQQQQTRSKATRKAGMQRSRGLEPVMEIKEHQTLELHGIRLVDLQSVQVAASSGTEAARASAEKEEHASDKSEGQAVTLNGARLRPTRVLNPHERELDEAVWLAFRENDFGRFFQILKAQRPELRVNPVAFQRPADGGSVLMAAAQHGRSDVIETLLRSSAASVLQQDWEGATAATFARRAGHTNVETALLACENAEHEKDYVYDVYCVDVSASQEHERSSDSTASSDDLEHTTSVNGVPVVSVSSAVQRWLSQDASMPSDEVEEYMLESDADSNEELDGYACLYRYPWDR